MTPKDLVKELIKDGWVECRSDGSHKTFKKPGVQKIITVPMHNKDMKPGTLHQIKKIAGLK